MARHDLSFELYCDGDWRPAPVYQRDTVKITRGVKSYNATADPAIVPLTLDNRSEYYSPRSVASPLFGKIGTNTKGRVIVDGSVQMTGEIPDWRPERAIFGDAWTSIDLCGVLRRLGRGEAPELSAARSAYDASIAQYYWSLEDPTGSVVAAGRPVPLIASGTVAFRSTTVEFPGSLGAVDLSGGSLSADLPVKPASAAVLPSWQVEFLGAYRNANVGTPSIAIKVTTTTGTVLNITLSTALWDGEPHHVALQIVATSGSAYNVTTYRDGVNVGTSGFSGSLGWPSRIDLNQAQTSGDTVPLLAHVAIFRFGNDPTGRAQAALGWPGELAADRFARLMEQYGIPYTIIGDPAESTAMGPQRPDKLLDLLAEIERTDDASVFETRDEASLTMRTGASKLNQTPALTISYLGEIQPPLHPVYGDEGIRNDVTGKGRDGSTFRVVQETGPRNIQLPEDDPQGVGRYNTSLEVNPSTFLGVGDCAGWRMSIGTFDGTWYAAITADLDAAPGIAAAADAVEIGDLLVLTSTPVDEALNDVEAIVIGIDQTVEEFRRLITFYCIPGAPYRVGILSEDAGDTDPDLGHFETDDSVVLSAVAAGSTAFRVLSRPGDTEAIPGTPECPIWTEVADDFPMDLVVGGQRVTVSAIGPNTNDAFGSRTVANGFGTEPTSGEAYDSSLGGSAGDYAVAAGVGTMALASANVFRGVALETGSSDKTLTVQLSVNVASAGGAAITQWVCGRYKDSSNYVLARLDLSTAGALSLLMAERVSGSLSTIASTTLLASGHASGDLWRVSIDVYDLQATVYAWQGVLSAKPAVPQLSGDVTLAEGTKLAILGRRESGNTDAGAVLTVDNVMVTNPQRVTLASGESFDYAVSAGADVTVAQPLILAL